MQETEGVIKFSCFHTFLEDELPASLLHLLPIWHQMKANHWIGVDEHNIGYGNASICDIQEDSTFWISGTQCTLITEMTAKYFCHINRFSLETNSVWSEGFLKPSSETMSHAAIYAANPQVRCVLHIHDSGLWNAFVNKLPTTPLEFAYGTVAISKSVSSLVESDFLLPHGVVIMGGHPDGLLAFGNSPEEAFQQIELLKTKFKA